MPKQESAEAPTAPQAAPPTIYYIVPSPYPPPAGAVYAGPQYGPYTSQVYQPQGPQDVETGQQPIPQEFGSSFDDEEIRRAFVRKVFAILTVQILLTAIIVAMFMFIEPMNRFLKTNWWFCFIMCGFAMMFMCILVCCDIRRKFPANYIVLTLLTISASIMIATPCVYYSVHVVVMAVGITSLICGAVSLAALLCPVDITGCGCMLLIATLSFVTFSLLAFVVQIFIGRITILQIVIGAIGTSLFSLYLMYDIQMIMGGKKLEISPEEHIVAVVQLYWDIITIFQYVLMLVGICEQN